MSVDQGVFDVFVTEKLHHVEDIFGLVVFGGGFPVAERVEGDLRESWVSEFVGYSLSLPLIRSAEMVEAFEGEDSYFRARARFNVEISEFDCELSTKTRPPINAY